MKYGVIPKCSPVAAQIVQVSSSGYPCRFAFLQSDGKAGSFSEIENVGDDEFWTAPLYDSLESAESVALGKPA